MNEQQIQMIYEEIKQRTRQVAYKLAINKERVPGICDSKFGGVPYWDLQKPYPEDSKGNKLMLLAQIKLSDVEECDRLPEKGMLQFFIGADDCFGIDFDNQDNGDTYCVIYHESLEESVTEEVVRGLEIPVATDPGMEEDSPIYIESAINITRQESYMGLRDYRFEILFKAIAKEKWGIELDDKDMCDVYEVLEGDDEEMYDTYDVVADNDEMTDEPINSGHWIFGYPFFTQTDPREYEERYRYYDTLLFQMDSEMVNGKDYILWGDCGVGNFFINAEDLKRRDFSKVLYNWDCC